MEQNTNQHLIQSLLGDVIDFTTKKSMEQDVGNFLAQYKPMYKNKQNYEALSNNIRHQYASALMAQKYGEDIARRLGDANEFFDFAGSGRADTLRDQRANEIGRAYGLAHPNFSKAQLLQGLYNNYYNY